MKYLLLFSVATICFGCNQSRKSEVEQSGKSEVEIVKESFNVIVNKISNSGSEDGIVASPKGNMWKKRKLYGINIKFNIQKTDSIISPFIAQIKWSHLQKTSDYYFTKGEQAEIKNNDLEYSLFWSAIFAYQDNQWVIKSIEYSGTDIWGKKLAGSYEGSGNCDGLINDWWKVLRAYPKTNVCLQVV